MAKPFSDLHKKLAELVAIKAENKLMIKISKKQIDEFVSKYKVFPSVKLLEADLKAYAEKKGLDQLEEGEKLELVDEPSVNPLVDKALALGIKTIVVGEGKEEQVITVQNATDEQLTAAIEAKEAEGLDDEGSDGEGEDDLPKELDDLTDEEIKAKAKELGVKSWHLKSKEKLILEIEEILANKE